MDLRSSEIKAERTTTKMLDVRFIFMWQEEMWQEERSVYIIFISEESIII